MNTFDKGAVLAAALACKTQIDKERADNVKRVTEQATRRLKYHFFGPVVTYRTFEEAAKSLHGSLEFTLAASIGWRQYETAEYLIDLCNKSKEDKINLSREEFSQLESRLK